MADQSENKRLSYLPRTQSKKSSGREIVGFNVKGPVAVSLDEEDVSSPGCSVLDLQFAVPSQLQTHSLSYSWRFPIPHYFMPCPPSDSDSDSENARPPRSERDSAYLISLTNQLRSNTPSLSTTTSESPFLASFYIRIYQLLFKRLPEQGLGRTAITVQNVLLLMKQNLLISTRSIADSMGTSHTNVLIVLYEWRLDILTGSECIQAASYPLGIQFSQWYLEQVGEVVFRNYYTAWLTVLVKFDPCCRIMLTPRHINAGVLEQLPANVSYAETGSERMEVPGGGWIIAIARRILMGNPHMENGSHDVISISATESQIEWKGLSAIRLVLRQPSPVWRTFHVEEINVFRDLPRRVPKPIQQSQSIMEPSSIQQYEPYLALLHNQTLAALNWAPELKDNSNCKDNSGSCGYEFFSLPQI